MNSRDYYKVVYTNPHQSGISVDNVLDNDTEFNANQFKLYDDFTTDLRLNYDTIRNNFQGYARQVSGRRNGDPNDSGVDMENGNALDEVTPSKDSDLLENEVMIDPWSSMDSANSPLTDSGPSASDDYTPSTSSEPPRGPLNTHSPLTPDANTKLPNPKDTKPLTNKNVPSKPAQKARSRDLTLELENLEPRRPHFLDDDYQPTKTNIESRIPKPHFLDHSPSPDEFDERSDITNPNFLDDEVDGDDNNAQKRAGALPKRPLKPQSSTFSSQESRPHRTNYRSTLHYGMESAARSSERDKRASQLYRGTWPGERDVWAGQDSSSVRSFSSNGSNEGPRPPSNLDNKMDCVFSLISLLSLSPENNADLSGPLLEMSRSVESCIAMRQAGCIPLLVQLIHSKVSRETRDRAAKALRNIIHTQTDDKAGRREARVWRLLEQVREYCYVLEDIVEARKDGKEIIEDDATKHPSQSVAALMKLSFDEEHRHVVCQLGGLQALAALVSGDQAAHGSRTDDNTCLTMRKYAGMTLTNLTFGDGNNKSLLCSFKDFMLALVEQLESPNDDMRQVTAAVLRNLSWRADTNSKQVLREVGAVKGLTKAAMTCQKEATLKSVLSALWNLTAHCSMNKVALCSVDGALGFLVDMLSYNSPTKTLAIVENAGGIMRNVSSHIAVREDYRQILRERSCLSVLLQHLKSPSLTVVSNSCGTLWNLSARCPQDQEFLWDHGAVPMLRSLIHSKHKMIAMGSSAALKNLLNSKPGKSHIIALDSTARGMHLPVLPTLGARKQKALEHELDQNLAETCDNIEPATSPTTNNRDEKNLFTATERQIAMNLERHRMTSSSPLMGTLTSQISLSHSAHLASYLSCSNTLLKGAVVAKPNTGSSSNVNRSDSKDSVTSTHSDSVFERAMRTGKVPVPTPRSKDLMKIEPGSEVFNSASKAVCKDGFGRYPVQPPIPPPRSSTDVRTTFTETGYDVDQDSCDQPIDYSRKYSETKSGEIGKNKNEPTKKYTKKESPSTFGDYQETDLDQPTDYSLRYTEHQSELGSDSEPPGPSDTIKHFATEGTPYETPIIFSTATSMSDLRVIGKDAKQKTPSAKENPEIMTHSDEKDTCSIEDPPRHDNDLVSTPPTSNIPETEPKREVFDTKFSSGMISPEKPVNYCDEGTPGYFSRVSSLSSVGEETEEDCLAKKNAMATINVEPSIEEPNVSISKDKEGSKAVTFAREAVSVSASPGVGSPGVQETPLMFSRSSSLGSLPDCSHDDHGSVISEFSRLPSGCLSPSELPDSPGHSVPAASPPAPRTPTPPPEPTQPSVFEERVSQFLVEDTPAQFSAATSLSSLTIDLEPQIRLVKEPHGDIFTADTTAEDHLLAEENEISDHVAQSESNNSTTNDIYKGSNEASGLLSAESSARVSDSSSDSGDLLEQCILKGIAKVVKNKGPSSDTSSIPFSSRGDVYRSLPPYLRSSTETVKMSRDVRDRSSERVAPPLPPKLSARAPPPRPPLPVGNRGRFRPLADGDSTSSLSLDSFGSTDREIFEETVKAGLPHRDHSTSSLSNDSFGSTDKEVFERIVRAGISRARRPRSAERRPRPARQPRAVSAGHSTGHPPGHSAGHTPGHTPGHAPPLGTASSQPVSPPKNVPPPSAHRACADGGACAQGGSRSMTPHSRTHAALDTHTDDILNTVDTSTKTNNDIDNLKIKHSIHDSDVHGNVNETENFIEEHTNDEVRQEEHNYTENVEHTNNYSERSSPNEDQENIYENICINRSLHISESDLKCSQTAESTTTSLNYTSENNILDNKDESKRYLSLDINKTSTQAEDNDSFKCTLSIPICFANSSSPKTAVKSFEYKNNAQIKEVLISKSQNVSDFAITEGYESSNLPAIAVEVDRDRSPNEINDMNVSNTYNIDVSNEACAELIENSVNSELNTLQSSQDLHRSNEAYADPCFTNLNESYDDVTNLSATNELDLSNEAYADVFNALDVHMTPKHNTSNEGYAEIEKHLISEHSLIVPPIDLDKSNESYAEITDSSDGEQRPESAASTVTRDARNDLEWIPIGTNTWDDHTCPDDVTFPTISGSIPGDILPDLLDTHDGGRSSHPDLTNRLESNTKITIDIASFASLDSEARLDSIMSSAIEKEAARLAAQLKSSQFNMEASATSLTSLDLDNVRPPSNLGSLLSLSVSGNWEESSQSPKKTQRSRKKSLPVAMMVKRALGNSMHQGSTEHLDSNPISFLENVKPPSEMENLDMEGSMVSVSSIVSEVAETKERTPIVFDLKQPIQDFPHCNVFYHDLDNVNPPSLFDEMAESTVEVEQTTAQNVYEDCVSNTLNVVTDIPSGSETCTPLPSDISSVESTPKRQRDPNYLTPKEKRYVSKDRYQTYTITDTVTEDDVVLQVADEEFLTWTKSESDKSEEYVTANSETKSRRKLSAKQRRLEDRARYQTQTVDLQNVLTHEMQQPKVVDPHIESLKQRLAAKKTIKQKRKEDAERFRTRTLSEDIPPSPTFVTKDANFENVETTTGYDSLSSNELNHQQLMDDRQRDDDVFSRDADSGLNEDDSELHSSQLQTYTKSFRNYLPVVESPAAVDMCVINNLKNIEMTASYKLMQENSDKIQNCSSDFASFEGDSNSEDRAQSESDQETSSSRPKPKIIKPNPRHNESFDSNESLDKEQDMSKGVRGRKKAMYVSPYRRNTSTPKKPTTPAISKTPLKAVQTPKSMQNTGKPSTSAKTPSKTPTASKPPSANTSPKKSLPNRSPIKTLQQKPVTIPLTGIKPLPLERQGTFVKEESTVPPKDLPKPDKQVSLPQYSKASSPTKPVANTSPSRLPQLNRFTRPSTSKAQNKTPTNVSNGKRSTENRIKNSPSNHSLQSNDSGKTVTLASRSSRQGSTSSVNSVQSTKNTKDVESKIASLWKKVEQSKKQPTKPDKRVWIESEQPKLIRSSTFEGQPKLNQPNAQKHKSAIGIRLSQIPSLKPKSTPAKAAQPASSVKKTPNSRVFTRKQANSQANT